MKGWQVWGIAIMMVLCGVIGWASQSAINGVHHDSASSNIVGHGINSSASMALNSEFGVNVHYEVRSQGGPLNVYITNLSNLLSARASGHLVYFPEQSVLNTTLVQVDAVLSKGPDIEQIVIESAAPEAQVQFSSSYEQSSYPLSLIPLFEALTFICGISTIALFVLLIYSISAYLQERGRSPPRQ